MTPRVRQECLGNRGMPQRVRGMPWPPRNALAVKECLASLGMPWPARNASARQALPERQALPARCSADQCGAHCGFQWRSTESAELGRFSHGSRLGDSARWTPGVHSAARTQDHPNLGRMITGPRGWLRPSRGGHHGPSAQGAGPRGRLLASRGPGPQHRGSAGVGAGPLGAILAGPVFHPEPSAWRPKRGGSPQCHVVPRDRRCRACGGRVHGAP
jgi:hypothetical protein